MMVPSTANRADNHGSASDGIVGKGTIWSIGLKGGVSTASLDRGPRRSRKLLKPLAAFTILPDEKNVKLLDIATETVSTTNIFPFSGPQK
jgi:hypothetical protein